MKNLLNKIKKALRKYNYYHNHFMKEKYTLNIIKGLNPDKHKQMFESFFLAQEHYLGYI